MGEPIRFNIVRKMMVKYFAEIVRVLKNGQTRPFAYRTDDAKQLQFGYTSESLLKPARDLLAAHKLRLNNPHVETAASIGTMPAAEITALANSKMSQGFLPISHYGFSDFLTDSELRATVSYVDFTVRFGTVINAFIAGRSVALPVASFDLRAMFGARYTNNTFDIALQTKFGVMGYTFREVKRALIPIRPIDTETYMYLGTVTTGDLGITALTLNRCVRIDSIRVSENPIGSAMPASSNPFDTTNSKLKAGW